MTLLERWTLALDSIVVNHIDPTCKPILDIVGPDDCPTLNISVENARDTCDQSTRFAVLTVQSVRLTYWPGMECAQAWIAAGWTGYIMHEALELVTACGSRPLDPHEPPYTYDRGLRVALPRELNPATMRAALETIMYPEAAERLISEGDD